MTIDYTSRLITITDLNVKHIFAHFFISQFNYNVGGVYIPPQSSHVTYESHVDSVEHLIINQLINY